MREEMQMPEDDKSQYKPDGRKTTDFGERPVRETYQPTKDNLDPSKPPQGSGVPPKDSPPKEDKKSEQ
jgi:hypothetical protein